VSKKQTEAIREVINEAFLKNPDVKRAALFELVGKAIPSSSRGAVRQALKRRVTRGLPVPEGLARAKKKRRKALKLKQAEMLSSGAPLKSPQAKKTKPKKIKLGKKNVKKHVSWLLDRELILRIKVAASQDGISTSTLLNDVMTRFLANRKSKFKNFSEQR